MHCLKDSLQSVLESVRFRHKVRLTRELDHGHCIGTLYEPDQALSRVPVRSLVGERQSPLPQQLFRRGDVTLRLHEHRHAVLQRRPGQTAQIFHQCRARLEGSRRETGSLGGGDSPVKAIFEETWFCKAPLEQGVHLELFG